MRIKTDVIKKEKLGLAQSGLEGHILAGHGFPTEVIVKALIPFEASWKLKRTFSPLLSPSLR